MPTTFTVIDLVPPLDLAPQELDIGDKAVFVEKMNALMTKLQTWTAAFEASITSINAVGSELSATELTSALTIATLDVQTQELQDTVDAYNVISGQSLSELQEIVANVQTLIDAANGVVPATGGTFSGDITVGDADTNTNPVINIDGPASGGDPIMIFRRAGVEKSRLTGEADNLVVRHGSTSLRVYDDFVISSVPIRAVDDDAANSVPTRSYVDAEFASLDGDTFTGAVVFNAAATVKGNFKADTLNADTNAFMFANHPIRLSSAAAAAVSNDNDLASKGYADTKFAKTGGTLTGDTTIAKASAALILSATGATHSQIRLDVNGGQKGFIYADSANDILRVQKRDTGGTTENELQIRPTETLLTKRIRVSSGNETTAGDPDQVLTTKDYVDGRTEACPDNIAVIKTSPFISAVSDDNSNPNFQLRRNNVQSALWFADTTSTRLRKYQANGSSTAFDLVIFEAGYAAVSGEVRGIAATSSTGFVIKSQLDAKLSKTGGTMSGNLVVPDGSETTPSLQFTDDDTGLFVKGSLWLSAKVNGEESVGLERGANNTMHVYGGDSLGARMRLYESQSNGSNYVEHRGPTNMSNNYAIVWPDSIATSSAHTIEIDSIDNTNKIIYLEWA